MRKCIRCGLESDDLTLFKEDAQSLCGRMNICNECATTETKARLKSRKDILAEFEYGTPCEICGGIFPPGAMDFHPTISSSVSLGKLLKELGKSKLVCACCHRALHSRD